MLPTDYEGEYARPRPWQGGVNAMAQLNQPMPHRTQLTTATYPGRPAPFVRADRQHPIFDWRRAQRPGGVVGPNWQPRPTGYGQAIVNEPPRPVFGGVPGYNGAAPRPLPPGVNALALLSRRPNPIVTR